MSVSAKICGLSTEATVASAVEGGADYIGFVFYPRSPRAVTASRAADLARPVPARIRKVGLFVDPTDTDIEQVLGILPLDILQLHGSEPPDRCAALRDRFRRPVMKAIKIGAAEDVGRAETWMRAVDMLLFDAKPPSVDALPGGNGVAFDWRLLADRSWPLPWMLSGGLTPDSLRDAVRATRAAAVDVSSGVETSPGVKDVGLIRAFLAAAKGL